MNYEIVDKLHDACPKCGTWMQNDVIFAHELLHQARRCIGHNCSYVEIQRVVHCSHCPLIDWCIGKVSGFDDDRNKQCLLVNALRLRGVDLHIEDGKIKSFIETIGGKKK